MCSAAPAAATAKGASRIDGISIGSTIGGGGSTAYIFDVSNAEEVVTTNSGGLGDSEVNGPSLNVVPRTGGNTFRGSAYLSGVPPGWVGSNYSEELMAAGLRTPGSLIKQWDFDTGFGGPIMRDALWYFVTARDEGQHRTIPGIFPNLNAGDPTTFLYAPDTTKEARGAESWQLGRCSSHLAGHAAQQIQLRLERADPVQWRGVHGRRRLPHAAR